MKTPAASLTGMLAAVLLASGAAVGAAERWEAVLLNELDALDCAPIDQLLERRYQRLRGYGAYEAA